VLLSRASSSIPDGQWGRYAPRLPRISVVGNELQRLGVRFKSWGFQQFNFMFLQRFYDFNDRQENVTMAACRRGDAGMGANSFRAYLELWSFIDGTSESGLSVNAQQMRKFVHLLELCRQNQMYVLISGANTWDITQIPAWFDELDYLTRWDVYEFFWTEIAKAVVASGNSSTVLGYELLNEPSISADANASWYGADAFGVGLYYGILIAKGPEVDYNTVRDWIVQLRDAIKTEDPPALVTVGVYPFFTGSFGYTNTQDLLDFLSPHLYPPLIAGFGGSLAEQLAYIDGWVAGATIPIVCGETAAWSPTESDNEAVFDSLTASIDGIITFSYGYPPEDFPVPPDPPKYPAPQEAPLPVVFNPDAYALTANAIAFFTTYRDDFLAG